MTRLVLFHPMDPRGSKMGGIETHVRLVLTRHPETMSVLLVGVDEIGDGTLGEVRRVVVEGRTIDFLPVIAIAPERINVAARRIGRSTTLRFLLGALRHLGGIRRAMGQGPASCEIERFEFAVLPRLLQRRCVLLVHNEGTREDQMDSLLKRYWVLHRLNERIALTLADRVVAVNEAIAARIATLSRRFAAKTEVMSVSVDTERFVPTPFEASGNAFRVCFAGRLDAFKDPPTMFASLALAAERLARRPIGRFTSLAFDYVGASDPTREPEFARISDLTTRHGIRRAAEVAAILRGAHAGIITSFFEGLPCYLLEMLATGRPVAAVTLPQFAPLIVPGRSGRLVARSDDPAATASAVADALLALAAEIEAGALDPAAIAKLAGPYSVATQMTRLFARHEALAAGGGQASESTRAA